jgi:DNA-binding beta-propeller fold protein YncE
MKRSIGWSTIALVLGAAACSSQLGGSSGAGTTQSAFSIGGQDAAEKAFTAFESGQVRPLALSADGKLLFAVNTPDNRLEIYKVHKHGGIEHVSSVPVGLEPVAVAARPCNEVWVVNHVSDSVSIVDVSQPEHAHVTRTLLVGDEPRDIVFAGADGARAFITTAHRGQNIGFDPQPTTPGVGRADVWVFDANNLGASLGGAPVSIVNLFSDTPRALAVTPDGSTVYAAAFHSGNRTTTIHERIVTNNGFLPPPNTNAAGIQQPLTGLIVKYKPGADGTLHWFDNVGRVWDSHVKFSLPDKDVFAIDATANPPAQRSDGLFTGVGTVLFNMAVNPVNGKVYVANTDARNDVRFEGHNAFGESLGHGGSVRGHIAESRITVLDALGGSHVNPRHLNKHLDFTQDGTPAEAAKSLAFPMGMAISSDGAKLYVAAFGSSKVGVYNTAELENDTFVPSVANEVTLTGGGPSGVLLDEKSKQLFVLTRFDNAISVVDTHSKQEIAHVRMFNPEPASITKGRRFLYDAQLTSSHGDSACASCHIFGDLDSLAWDLGDPDNTPVNIPGPFAVPLQPFFPPTANHPLKGPMTTQSLRGMANHGPMHWRGDRTGGNDAASAQPNSGTFDEDAAFKKFNVAFPGLLGRAAQLDPAEIQAFTDFILQVTYPPNPNRNLDNSLTADQAAGRAFFFNHATVNGVDQEIPSDTFHNCNGCHTLDPNGNAQYGVAKPGFFGSDGKYSFEGESQFMKVPHLRNAYAKIGMFGMDNTFGLPIDVQIGKLLAFLPEPLNTNQFLGDQVRGFGFTHDGSADTLFRFFGANVFVQRPITNQFPNPGGIPADASGVLLRRQIEAFVLVFDSNVAPIVGQQITLSPDAASAAGARVDLLEARARAGECDLVVHGRARGRDVAYLYDAAGGAFLGNRAGAAKKSDAQVRAQAAHGELTFTAVPVGSGRRIAIDHDLDGVLDGDEAECDGDD